MTARFSCVSGSPIRPATLCGLPRRRLTPLARESAPQDYVLARAGKDGLDWLAASGLNFEVLDTAASSARYLMVDLAGPQGDTPAGRLLFADGQRALWRVEATAELPHEGHSAWFIDRPIRLLPRSSPHCPTRSPHCRSFRRSSTRLT